MPSKSCYSSKKKVKFTIGGKLPGFNELILWAKQGRGRSNKYSREKRKYTKMVADILGSKRKSLGIIKLQCTFYEQNKRRDPDNFVGAAHKLILDGMVLSGLIDNDGWKNVAGFTDTWEVDKNNPRIEVVVTKCQNKRK